MQQNKVESGRGKEIRGSGLCERKRVRKKILEKQIQTMIHICPAWLVHLPFSTTQLMLHELAKGWGHIYSQISGLSCPKNLMAAYSWRWRTKWPPQSKKFRVPSDVTKARVESKLSS